MAQMVEKGYATSLSKITFNDSRWTELQNASTLTTSLGAIVEKNVTPGIYTLGIANGLHSMTLTYDGEIFSLFDQGTGWGGTWYAPETLDAQLEHITKGLHKYATDNVAGYDGTWSSVLSVHKLSRN